MESIECARDCPPEPGSIDDPFQQLRRAFQARLRNDGIHLTHLRTSLTRAPAAATAVFAEIQGFAHKLRGAAAIFDAIDIGRAAEALELATVAASAGAVAAGDPAVSRALDALANLLIPANNGGGMPQVSRDARPNASTT
jgi:hypothetical protein